ncbi:hypothetical protein JB92DRAFT_507498 [Gautieria morchelliformis]|nr:hypothetical protein JB92DRAFT_507498 [Gautieria morchelliformis]
MRHLDTHHAQCAYTISFMDLGFHSAQSDVMTNSWQERKRQLLARAHLMPSCFDVVLVTLILLHTMFVHQTTPL